MKDTPKILALVVGGFVLLGITAIIQMQDFGERKIVGFGLLAGCVASFIVALVFTMRNGESPQRFSGSSNEIN